MPDIKHIPPMQIEISEDGCSCFRKREKPKTHEHVEITATGVKVHAVAEPILNTEGFWEIEIDGKKYGLTAIEHQTNK